MANFCRNCGTPLVHDVELEISKPEKPNVETSNEDQRSVSADDWTSRSRVEGRHRHGNPVRNHWRGIYFPPAALFVVGFAAISVVAVYWLAISYYNPVTKSNHWLGGVLLIVKGVLPAGVAFWFLVGLWRSSLRYIYERGRPMIWMYPAIGTTVVVWLFIVNGSLIWHLIATGKHLIDSKTGMDSFTIHVVNDGKELILDGIFDAGLSRELRAKLAQSPAVKVIHLESGGGFISEGVAVATIIEEYRLQTYTAVECSSACVIAFSAGTQRFLGENGKLGFHSASIGTLSGKDRDFINDEFIAAFENRGVNPSFASQAISYEPDAMWYPSHDELLVSGVVDSIIDPAYLGSMPLSRAIDAHALEKQLLSVEIYSLLKRHVPSLYSDAMEVVMAGLVDGKPTVEIQAALRETIFPIILSKFLDKAPNDEIWEYYFTQLLELQEFKDKSVLACAAVAFPSYVDKPINMRAVLPADLLQRDLAALARAFKASLSDPVSPDEDLEESI